MRCIRGQLTLGCVALVMMWVSATGASAQEFAEPGGTIYDAIELPLDETQSGTIETPGDIDVFAVHVPPSLGVLRVVVQQSNKVCELWARTIDRAGTDLSSYF